MKINIMIVRSFAVYLNEKKIVMFHIEKSLEYRSIGFHLIFLNILQASYVISLLSSIAAN